MCSITPLVSHTWGMNSSHSKRAERNILRINRLAVALLIWLKWGGREIILVTARIRFVVSKKRWISYEAFSLLQEKLSWIWVWKQLQRLQRQRALSEMCVCRRLGTSPSLGRWGDTASISPSTCLGCLGSRRRKNGFAAMRCQERWDRAES